MPGRDTMNFGYAATARQLLDIAPVVFDNHRSVHPACA